MPEQRGLGDPIDGTQLHIDGDGTGELLISGNQLADGYWNDAERSARAFTQQNGDRVYRTGDFVTRKPQGLFFVERRDHQVKVKGYRVELGEISARIRSLGFVTAETIADGQSLVSFVEGKLSKPELQDLRASLEKTLDSHMVPAHLVPLEQFPRNANDKIEVRALAELWRQMKGNGPA